MISLIFISKNKSKPNRSIILYRIGLHRFAKFVIFFSLSNRYPFIHPSIHEINEIHRIRNESNDISPAGRLTQNYDSVSRPLSPRCNPCIHLDNRLFPYSVWKRSREKKKGENHGRGARFTEAMIQSPAVCVHEREREREGERRTRRGICITRGIIRGEWFINRVNHDLARSKNGNRELTFASKGCRCTVKRSGDVRGKWGGGKGEGTAARGGERSLARSRAHTRRSPCPTNRSRKGAL